MIEKHEITNSNFGIILLAAGSSSRLGRPKQLLKFHSHTLLQHSLKIAIASNANKIVVVLGANAENIKKEIDYKNIHIAVNSRWQEGMASSIRCGINAMIEINPSMEGVIIMVCDQPHTSTILLNTLLATYQQTKKEIVASGYENIIGTPVFFHRSLFTELLQLTGDMGARRLILQYANKVEVVPFPEGKIDIDTEQDYRKLLDNIKEVE